MRNRMTDRVTPSTVRWAFNRVAILGVLFTGGFAMYAFSANAYLLAGVMGVSMLFFLYAVNHDLQAEREAPDKE